MIAGAGGGGSLFYKNNDQGSFFYGCQNFCAWVQLFPPGGVKYYDRGGRKIITGKHYSSNNNDRGVYYRIQFTKLHQRNLVSFHDHRRSSWIADDSFKGIDLHIVLHIFMK